MTMACSGLKVKVKVVVRLMWSVWPRSRAVCFLVIRLFPSTSCSVASIASWILIRVIALLQAGGGRVDVLCMNNLSLSYLDESTFTNAVAVCLTDRPVSTSRESWLITSAREGMLLCQLVGLYLSVYRIIQRVGMNEFFHEFFGRSRPMPGVTR